MSGTTRGEGAEGERAGEHPEQFGRGMDVRRRSGAGRNLDLDQVCVRTRGDARGREGGRRTTQRVSTCSAGVWKVMACSSSVDAWGKRRRGWRCGVRSADRITSSAQAAASPASVAGQAAVVLQHLPGGGTVEQVGERLDPRAVGGEDRPDVTDARQAAKVSRRAGIGGETASRAPGGLWMAARMAAVVRVEGTKGGAQTGGHVGGGASARLRRPDGSFSHWK